jgi:hypothetical protein
MAGHNIWSVETRKRANREHARKKRSRKQRQHLQAIKSKEELRQIRIGCRNG